ncbi:MAG: rhodanese-like domain-containing protein [Desulfobacterales bacterium]|jgi:rhodanese-related sulfurtransferase
MFTCHGNFGKRPDILLRRIHLKAEPSIRPAAGAFKTAVNIPTDELEKKIPTLATDKPIVFVCSTGARSGEAYYMVQDIRPELKKVYYLEAETIDNKDGSAKITKPQ